MGHCGAYVPRSPYEHDVHGFEIVLWVSPPVQGSPVHVRGLFRRSGMATGPQQK